MTHDPDPLAQLLRSAVPRATAPADRAPRVEAEVRIEWQAAVQRRVGRRRASWIAVSCLTSAALMALMLHAHVPPQGTVTPLSMPQRTDRARSTVPRGAGSYVRANNEDRPPDRGAPRHTLAHFTWDTR